MERALLSTVTPVYRGAKYLRELVAELNQVRTQLASLGDRVVLVEAIFVDDDSRDGSAAVLAELQAQHDWVKVITLSRNYGQHAATAAGILHSSGDWVTTLDEDLQHHPKYLLPLLLKAATEGLDVVYAKPRSGPHGSVYRDWASRLSKEVISRVSGNPHTTKFNSFRMGRGSVLRAAASVVTHSTYFDMAICWFTTRISSLDLPLYDARYAEEKVSSYNLYSLIRHGKRLILSSDLKVLRAGALIGVLALIGCTLFGAKAFYDRVTMQDPMVTRGWTSTVLIVLFLGGLTCLLLSIALEYMSVILRNVQGKPNFLVIDRSGDAELTEYLRQGRFDAVAPQ